MNVISFDNQADSASSLQIEPVGGRLGARVNEIQLAKIQDAQTIADIDAALARHKVLFFRGQEGFDDASQEAFAARLGRPIAHPTLEIAPGSSTILELDAMEGRVADQWHTDVTFVAAYPRASILRAVRMPEAGGDTMWADTAAAYRYLPAALQTLADVLWVRHDNIYDYAVTENKPHAGYASTFMSTRYETEHPLVRVHPVTQERTLILGAFAKQIVGMRTRDSRALIDMFTDHILQPENIVRWRWQENDVVIWDNRATQHRVAADFGSQSRTVRRVTLAGEAPVSVDGRTSSVIQPAALDIAAE